MSFEHLIYIQFILYPGGNDKQKLSNDNHNQFINKDFCESLKFEIAANIIGETFQINLKFKHCLNPSFQWRLSNLQGKKKSEFR